jgi:hypothetical protein
MDQVWDAGGEASLALARVVQGFGVPVLGQADLLEGLLNDEVPESPREVAMLTEAARYGIAELLTERVRQGVSAQAAAAMVAAEMTSRTAVDSVGARWAAQKFATVIGLQLTGTAATMPITDPGPLTLPTVDPPPPAGGSPVPPAGSPPVSVPPVSDVPGSAPATRLMASGPPRTGAPLGPGLTGSGLTGPAVGGSAYDAAGDATVLPGQPTVFGPPPGQVSPYGGQPLTPGQPAFGQPAFGQPAFGQPGGSKAGRGGAALTLLAVVLLLAWGVFPRSHSQTAVFWLSSLVLLAGGVAVATWSARDQSNGFGLAAVLGIGLPLISWSLFDASFAPELTGFSHPHRDVLLAASVLAMLAAIAAVLIALAALIRRRQLVPQSPGPLTVVLLILGVAYPLTNLLPQVKFDGTGFGNVLGHGVSGWHIIWGLVFLGAFALPPILAAFLRPGTLASTTLWAGWLFIVLSWQISDTPADGESPAAGLVLSWLVWVALVVGTLILVGRRSSAPAVSAADRAAVGGPWSPPQG